MVKPEDLQVGMLLRWGSMKLEVTMIEGNHFWYHIEGKTYTSYDPLSVGWLIEAKVMTKPGSSIVDRPNETVF